MASCDLSVSLLKSISSPPRIHTAHPTLGGESSSSTRHPRRAYPRNRHGSRTGMRQDRKTSTAPCVRPRGGAARVCCAGGAPSVGPPRGRLGRLPHHEVAPVLPVHVRDLLAQLPLDPLHPRLHALELV